MAPNSTRFVVNTTAGIAGTMDVATRMGLQRQPEDFGKTLGRYGVGAGPYIVLPVLGFATWRLYTRLVER